MMKKREIVQPIIIKYEILSHDQGGLPYMYIFYILNQALQTKFPF
jgi:hypothetical protein